MWSFGSLFLFDAPYTKGDEFTKARISFINNEINYFKNSYLDNTISYSFYNTLAALINHSKTNYELNNNYTKDNRNRPS